MAFIKYKIKRANPAGKQARATNNSQKEKKYSALFIGSKFLKAFIYLSESPS